MRTLGRWVIMAASSVCMPGLADAADLSTAEITKLISGKTVYLELTATSSGGAGTGAIYYAADGASAYKTAKGEILHGKWTTKDNMLCNDWKERPGNACTRYDKQGDVITLINAATKEPRGKIAKIVDGNPEKLTP